MPRPEPAGKAPRRSTPQRSAARARSAEFTEARQRVLRRDGGCVARGWQVDCWGGLHVHHIVRRSQGGTHDDDNLVTLCAGHHGYVHEHPALARERGLLA